MGGNFIIYNGDNNTFYNIYPESEYYFWIQASQFQKMTIYLKYNSIKENAINNINIYEYYSQCIDCEIYEHINQIITPQRKDNNELSFYFPYTIRQEKTRHALIKIKTKEYLEYLDIKVNIHGEIYYLIDNIPKDIRYIYSGNLFYFFINATKYNELITQFTFNKRDEDIEPFKYLLINEYEDKNIATFIESTNQSYEIKSEENGYKTDYKINISYIPSNPLTKYIAFIFEANCDIDYLSTKVNVGGGCYEFKKNININKIIANTTYYFPIKISMFQEIEMNIICDDNINSNKPFKFANIYEKQKKDDNIYNKYHHQAIIASKKSGKINEYFFYTIENFTTNYIMIELIPNCNIDNLFLEYEIETLNYNLFKGDSKNLNNIIKNTPYYYYISSKQYKQVNIYLTMDYKNNTPFEFVEIYELVDKDKFNSAKKYINKTINFVNDNNNILTSKFNYMIESIYTNYIIIKVLPKCDLDFLNIKMNNGGGYYELEVNTTKNITNLYSDFSYYFLVLCSKEEKVNFKFIINSNETNQPFNVLNVYEYSNKNNPSIYLLHTNEKFNFEKNENNSMILLTYKAINNSTNYIGLEIIPNYDISYIECSIEVEKVELREKNNSNTFSVEKILTIILIVIVCITTIIFIIYLKKNCTKSSSNSIEDVYEKNKGNISKNKKFELNLLD